MHIQTDRQFVPAHATTTGHLLIQITAPGRTRQVHRPPVRVGLVLDRSGSMSGDKIALARTAVDHAIRVLAPTDHLAVVCFDTGIDTILGATRATAEAKALAVQRLARIDARGGTDLHGGWMRGAGELQTGPATDDPRRILLLTDGQANHGETDPDALAACAARLRAAGVQTTTFGLGRDFDEALLARLAREGGGNFYFIETPAQIQDFFTSELGEALEIVARDAEIITGGSPGVEVSCLNDFPTQPAADGAGLRIRLGDLSADQQISVLVAVRITSGDEGSVSCVRLRLADRERFGDPMTIEWQAVSADAARSQPIGLPVLVEAATLLASRARTAALDANRIGHYDRARAILTDAAGTIRALAAAPELQRIADELAAQAHDFAGDMDPMARKQMYFQSTSMARSRTMTGRAKKN